MRKLFEENLNELNIFKLFNCCITEDFLKLGMDYLCQQSGFLQSRNYITNTQEFGLRYLIESVML